MDPKDVFQPPDGTTRCSFTNGATLAVIDNYKAYCSRLAAVFANATASDSTDKQIILVGLEFRLKQRLDQTDTLVEQTSPDWGKTLGGMLEAAVKAKVKVRLLYGGDDIPDLPLATSLGIDARQDKQCTSRPHHQKAVFVAPGDGKDKAAILFVGGMDIAHVPGGWERTFWFDAMAEISGLAGATMGVDTLEERWASVVGLPWSGTGTPKGEVPKYKAGDTLITYVRTYALDPKDAATAQRKYAMDYSYRDTILRAIPKAQKSIYIEDQFFDHVPAVDALLIDAANRDPGPTIVVIGGRLNETGYGSRSVGLLRTKVKNQNRLHMLRLKVQGGRKPNLIHTKAWVFDDELAIIGSANYWWGSLYPDNTTQDSEFGVVFMAPAVATLRVQLWNRMIASATKPIPIPTPRPKGSTILADLAILIDRPVDDLKPKIASFLLPGARSTFEAMPPNETKDGP
jgi:phosphatidylserine/phosphatidylglycerophosphate/cardiolipin synthase-like enzyme